MQALASRYLAAFGEICMVRRRAAGATKPVSTRCSRTKLRSKSAAPASRSSDRPISATTRAAQAGRGRRRQVGAGALQRRRQAEQEPREQRPQQGEAEHAGVEVDLLQARQVA